MKILSVVFTLLLFLQSDLYSCICFYYPLNKQYKDANKIFIGKVIEGPLTDYSNCLTEHLYKFEVLKCYKGKFVDTIIIKTPYGGPACGFDFVQGETYLVYAYKGEIYSTSSCTRTKNIKQAQIDLEFLNRLPGSLISTGFAGHVYLFPDNASNKYKLPVIPNYSFQLKNDSLNFLIESDSTGTFYMDNIPPGKYNIALDKNSDLSFKQDFSFFMRWEFPENVIDISDSTILEKDLVLSNPNAMEGIILDENENPIRVIATLVPEIYFVDSLKNYNYETYECWTDSSGIFEFINIPDGKYYLGVNITGAPSHIDPYSTTFYKNSGSIADAELLEVKGGSRISNIKIRVNKTFQTYAIRCSIITSDGNKWKNADVGLYKTPKADYKEEIGYAMKYSEGVFDINILEDIEGWIVINPNNTSENQAKGLFPKTPEPFKINANTNYPNLVFTIEMEQKEPVIPRPPVKTKIENPMSVKYKNQDFIFTGRVLHEESTNAEIPSYQVEVFHYYRDREGYQNDTVVIYYDSYPRNYLSPGDEYLFHGFNEEEKYLVAPSGLILLSEAAEDTAFLNAPAMGKTNPVFTGKAFFFENNLQNKHDLPVMKNFTFNVHNLSGDYMIQTDSNGVFWMDKIPPGTYRITTDTVLHIDVYENSFFFKNNFTFEEAELISRDIIFTTTNTIEGVVFDNNDNPLAGMTVGLIPVLYGVRIQNNELDTWTNWEGKFEFINIPDGQYQLGINLISKPSIYNPYPVTTYIDSGKTVDSNILEVKGGRKITGIYLKAGEKYKKHSIEGKCIKSDGTPWVYGKVQLYNKDKTERLASSLRTTQPGSFLIETLDYMEGWLMMFPGNDPKLESKSLQPVIPEPIYINAGRDYTDLEFEIATKYVVKETPPPPEEEKWFIQKVTDEFFIPDEMNHPEYESLKALFRTWYFSSDERDCAEGSQIFKTTPSDSFFKNSFSTYYPDGMLKFSFDSLHFLMLEWRMLKQNNNIIAFIAPGGDIMYTADLLELKEDKLKIKMNGYFEISLEGENYHLISTQTNAHKKKKSSDILIPVEENKRKDRDIIK